MSIIHMSATELLARLEAGELTSVEVVRAFLDQIESHDAEIKAFIHVHADAAVARAEEIDGRRAAGQPSVLSRPVRKE